MGAESSSLGRTRAKSGGRGRVPLVVLAVGLAAFLALDPLGGAAHAAGTDGQLSQVRVGNDGAFDRVVFEFEGTAVPTVTLNGPRANPGTVPGDPSGMPIPVAGAQILTVVMHGAFAQPGYTGPTTITPTSTANVVQVVQTGDFEATLSWTIGMKVATQPVVTTVTDPVRVVVDIPHATTTSTTRATTATVAPVAAASPAFTG
jgi:hypothetical protein